MPCVTRMLPGGQGYRVEIGDPWADFPTDDVVADTTRMNAWIESVVRTMPEQYFGFIAASRRVPGVNRAPIRLPYRTSEHLP